jgi:uncharacterized membrane protein HdeD (DUF308 family)
VPAKKILTSTDESGTRVVTSREKIRSWMQVVISMVLLITGILILIDPATDAKIR